MENRNILIVLIIIIVLIVIWIILNGQSSSKKSSCVNDNDCPDGTRCNGGKCVACAFDSDCPGNQICRNGKCQSIPEIQCTENSFNLGSLGPASQNVTPMNMSLYDLFDLGAVQLIGANRGKIIAVRRNFIFRFNTDGSLDATFGISGIRDVKVAPLNTTNGSIGAFSTYVCVDENDNIYISYSQIDPDPFQRGAIVKLLPDGALDASWGVNGVCIPPPSLQDSLRYYTGLLCLDDGSLYVQSNNGYFIKIGPNGVADLTFAINGRSEMPTLSNGFIPNGSLGIDKSANHIYLVYNLRTVSTYTPASAGVARYTYDGMLDTNYGNGGVFIFDSSLFSDNCNGNSFINSFSLTPDNRLVVVGAYNQSIVGDCTENIPFASKLSPLGQLDTSFGTNGIYSDNTYPDIDEGFDCEARSPVIIDPCSGNIIITCFFFSGSGNWDGSYLLELTPDGQFVKRSETYESYVDTYTSFRWATPHPDGKIITFGVYYIDNSDYGARIWDFETPSINYAFQNRPW